MKLRVPHTFALLFGLIVLAALATHVLPAGEYGRVERGGRRVVEPGSYHAVAAQPAGLAEVFLAWPRGLEATAQIVFFIFLVAGAFGVVNATGATEAAIAAVVRAASGRGELVIPLLMLFFSIGGGTIGIAEECLPFLPALALLARRLGYDELTGGAIALVGAGAGFAGAFLNPFTVGVAQGIAGLPLYSGLGLRLACWAVMTALAIAWVSAHARRVRRAAAPAPEVGPASTPATPAQRRALLALATGLALVVAGVLRWQWGLLEMSGLWLAVGVAAGLLGGLGANRTAEVFLEGCAGIAGGALVVGLARGVLVIFDGARVTDTILNGLANGVAHLPPAAVVLGVYAVQVALSYVVPSGSGQAALSLPILVPLGEMVGVTRQTSVLAYQLGDGFSNIFTPTSGYFMAGLALIGVPWTRWARFIWPLQAMWLLAGAAFLLLAHAIQWGPF